MIVFDAHVHIHEVFSLGSLLASARHNLTTHLVQPVGGPPGVTNVLCLVEARGTDVFASLKETAAGRRPAHSDWRLEETEETESLRASHADWPGGQLFILAGRQLVTAERIEVLALATPVTIDDGLSLDKTVEEVKNHNGLAVLPWGVGKWLGKRGKIIENFVQQASPSGLFVGDNGGRPFFWPAPRLFATAAARGIRLLPGSDPLPLTGEEKRIGSCGGSVSGEITGTRPAADLRRLLIDPTRPIVPFGRRMGALRFLLVQMALRRLK